MKVVEKGRNAVLVCDAGGDPKPTVTWVKDTMPIDIEASPRLTLLKQGKLRGKAFGERSLVNRKLLQNRARKNVKSIVQIAIE